MRHLRRRQWHEGGNDPLDGYSEASASGQVVRSRGSKAVDVGPGNESEADQVADPLRPLRLVVSSAVELSARSPEEIAIECEEQDELLGLPKGTTLDLFMSAYRSTH